MIFEGEEQSVSDVSNETSSESQDQAAPSESQSAEKPEGQVEQQTDAAKENVPFHKHPRWIERDNELKTERQARQDLEKKYAEMESRLTQLSQPKAPPTPDRRAQMIERLKGIDPEFAEFVSDLAPMKEIQELREWKAAQAQEAMRTQAVQTVNQLHEANKVAPEDRNLYNKLLEAEIRANPRATVQDLPNLYKQVHESLNKRADAIRRAERESYLNAKKQVSNAPASQPKGKPATSNGNEFSKDPTEARQQLISRVLKQVRASDSL